MSEIPNDLKCMTFSKNDISRIERESYNQALKDLSKKINETFWQFQGEEGARNRALLDKIVEDLKEGKEE